MKRIILFLLILLFLSVRNVFASITLVNEADGKGTGTAVSSLSTSAISTTTGNLIVVTLALSGDGGASSVTDTAGNTYVQATGCDPNNSSTGINTDIWYAANITGNAANVATVHYLTYTYTYNGISQLQYSGAATSSPFESCANQSGYLYGQYSGNMTTGNFTPSITGGVAVAVGYQQSGANYAAISPYTQVGSAWFTEHLLNVGSGAQSASFTTSVNANAAISVAYFDPAGSGPAPGPSNTVIENAVIHGNSTVIE